MAMRILAVVGTKAGCPKFTDEVAERARLVGKMAGSLGFAILTGGKSGVMREAARGASEGGGLAIGILPEADRSQANEYLDIALPTGIGLARNVLVALGCHAMLALPGGLGTLQEMTYAIEHGRPVATWGGWDFLPDVARLADEGEVERWLRERHEELRHVR